jgi:nucleotide-binding universal stress UspA family protein
MKVIIAYDGSESAQEALDDLDQAGLGKNVDATILSVAELWLPPPSTSLGIDEPFPAYTPPEVRGAYETASRAIEQVRSVATEASTRVQATFPSWKVSTEVYAGSPAWEVIKKADESQPDLIVVGSQGRTALGRLFLGSVSQKILTEARCSVRVGRRPTAGAAPVNMLLVGVDGSPGGDAAVHELAKREWPSGIRVHVVTVVDPNVALAFGSLNAQVSKWIEEDEEGERHWSQKMVEASAAHLRQAGLEVHAEVKEGDAKRVLLDEAKRLHADCIFVGSTGFSNRLDRFLLGSVSAAVANRAECSVEVIRPKAVIKQRTQDVVESKSRG